MRSILSTLTMSLPGVKCALTNRQYSMQHASLLSYSFYPTIEINVPKKKDILSNYDTHKCLLSLLFRQFII